MVTEESARVTELLQLIEGLRSDVAVWKERYARLAGGAQHIAAKLYDSAEYHAADVLGRKLGYYRDQVLALLADPQAFVNDMDEGEVTADAKSFALAATAPQTAASEAKIDEFVEAVQHSAENLAALGYQVPKAYTRVAGSPDCCSYPTPAAYDQAAEIDRLRRVNGEWGLVMSALIDGLAARDVPLTLGGTYTQAALDEIDRLRSARTAGDEHLQALRDERDALAAELDDLKAVPPAELQTRVEQDLRARLDRMAAAAEATAEQARALTAERDEARREAERLRGDVARVEAKLRETAVAHFGKGAYGDMIEIASDLHRAINTGNSDGTADGGE